MSDVLKISVRIADRAYPLTVNPNQKEDLEKASSRINSAIEDFGQKYGVENRQDILAMVALQFATLLEKEASERLQIQKRLKRLSETLNLTFGDVEKG